MEWEEGMAMGRTGQPGEGEDVAVRLHICHRRWATQPNLGCCSLLRVASAKQQALIQAVP